MTMFFFALETKNDIEISYVIRIFIILYKRGKQWMKY